MNIKQIRMNAAKKMGVLSVYYAACRAKKIPPIQTPKMYSTPSRTNKIRVVN